MPDQHASEFHVCSIDIITLSWKTNAISDAAWVLWDSLRRSSSDPCKPDSLRFPASSEVVDHSQVLGRYKPGCKFQSHSGKTNSWITQVLVKTLDAVNGVFNGVFIMSYIALLTLLRIFTWGTSVPVVATCQRTGAVHAGHSLRCLIANMQAWSSAAKHVRGCPQQYLRVGLIKAWCR